MFNNYNPYAYGAYQQRPSQPTTAPYLKGRVVTGIDEVRASQVDLDGSVTYFASPAEARIYAKGIDMQGLPYIQVYELQKAQPMVGGTDEVMNRIASLENRMKEMESRVQYATDNANAG